MTVNTPTTAETTAVDRPTAAAMCTGPLEKKPGLEEEVHARSGDGQRSGDRGRRRRLCTGPATTRTRPWSLQHVDVVAVELG